MRGFVPKAVPVASDSRAALGYARARRTAEEAGTNVRFAGRGPDRPSTRWRSRLAEVKQFVADYGKLPESNGDKTEASLHGWLLEQRRSYRRQQMSYPKIVLLEELTGWNCDSHQESLDRQWEDKLAQLETYVNQHGGMPRYRTFASEDERALGVWLHKQHQRRAEEKIAGWRHVALDGAVLGWRSRA